MTFSPRSLPRIMLAASVLLGTAAVSAQPAAADPGFKQWRKGFYKVARRNGIKSSTLETAFAGIDSHDPEVLEKARYQPEFKSAMWQYFDSRVNDETAAQGRAMKAKYADTLARIEKRYGVDQDILLAIWSMESRYGEVLQQDGVLRPVVRSLGTLAYADKKRRRFATRQLLSSLKMLQKGQVKKDQLMGSWAGAMGHTQFIPTSYSLYKQNFDGVGTADIWRSVPDALATAANLLKKNGWRTGQTWGYEVNAKRLYGSRNTSRSVGAWRKMGVTRVAGRKFTRPGLKARLVFPAGRNGPAFLMLRNFYTIKKYNNANKYALAVGHLADRISGGAEFVTPLPRPYEKLSVEERKEMQRHLARMGLYDGNIDGRFGNGTRKGILAAQRKLGFKTNGFESPQLLQALRKRS